MFRVRTVITGAPGSPWYSNLYFLGPDGTQAVMDAVIAFWNDADAWIVNEAQWTVEDEVVVIDEATGENVAFQNLAGASAAGGSASTALARSTQGLLRFATNGVVNSRQVRGRMFVPGVVSTANDDGVPGTAYRSAIETAYTTHLQAVAIRDTNPHVIWSRPWEQPPDDPTAPATRAGSAHIVQSGSMWGQFAVQRSRRD